MKGIVLSSVAVSACLLLSGCLEAMPPEKIKANAEKIFSAHLQKDEDALLLGCSSQDSDRDRYVTCDTKSKQTGQYQSFECNYLSSESGCRLAKTKVIQEQEE